MAPASFRGTAVQFGGHTVSAALFGFGEGAQLFGVDVPQLLQLPLAPSVQILDVHHVRLLDAGVLSELVADSGDEARFVPPGSQELPVQSEDLLLQLTVPQHQTESAETRVQSESSYAHMTLQHRRVSGCTPSHVHSEHTTRLSFTRFFSFRVLKKMFACRKNTKRTEQQNSIQADSSRHGRWFYSPTGETDALKTRQKASAHLQLHI